MIIVVVKWAVPDLAPCARVDGCWHGTCPFCGGSGLTAWRTQGRFFCIDCREGGGADRFTALMRLKRGTSRPGEVAQAIAKEDMAQSMALMGQPVSGVSEDQPNDPAHRVLDMFDRLAEGGPLTDPALKASIHAFADAVRRAAEGLDRLEASGKVAQEALERMAREKQNRGHE